MDLAHELVKIGQLRGGAGCVQPYVAAKASAVNRVKKRGGLKELKSKS